jgi:peptide deformylase
MILPIYAYGQTVLKKEAEPIDPDYPDLEELVENMWETMYQAQGVGLAAPQIGRSIRLFVVDTIQLMEEGKEEEGIKQVFINAEKIEEAGDLWTYEEGCLSIPEVRGDVDRPPQLRLRYQDENFDIREKVFTGMNARVIQHEYDHIDGILFVEHLKPIKRRLVKRKLENIRKGKVKVDYRMKFPRR